MQQDDIVGNEYEKGFAKGKEFDPSKRILGGEKRLNQNMMITKGEYKKWEKIQQYGMWKCEMHLKRC